MSRKRNPKRKEVWDSGPEIEIKTHYARLPHQKAKVYLLWDLHYGALQTRYTFLRRTIKEIAETPNAYAILGGDVLEAISINDWRMFAGKFDSIPPDTSANELPQLFNIVFRAFERDFGPLRGKILGVLEGNHEEKLGRHLGMDFTALLAEFLEAPYLGYEAAIVIGLKRPDIDNYYTTTLAITHGWGGGRYLGGKLNRLDQWAGWWDNVDVFVSGHTHDGPYAVPVNKIRVVVGRKGEASVIPRRCWLIKPGSMRGDAYYRKKAGLRPSPNGYVCLNLSYDTRKVVVDPEIVLEK